MSDEGEGDLGRLRGRRRRSRAGVGPAACCLEHLPQSASDPALALIASQTQIEPGPTETSATLADRLVHASLQWQLAGSPLGLLLQLYYSDFTGAVLVQQNGRGVQIDGTPDLDDLGDLTTAPSWITITTLGTNPPIPASTDGRPAIAGGTVPWWEFPVYTGAPSGTNANMDSAGNQFTSRFAVLFDVAAGATDPQLGTAENLARIQRLIARWRPAKATCVGIYVCTAGRFVGWPVRIVGSGGTVGPSTITTYAGA
jgi:hypothetical protein